MPFCRRSEVLEAHRIPGIVQSAMKPSIMLHNRRMRDWVKRGSMRSCRSWKDAKCHLIMTTSHSVRQCVASFVHRLCYIDIREAVQYARACHIIGNSNSLNRYCAVIRAPKQCNRYATEASMLKERSHSAGLILRSLHMRTRMSFAVAFCAF